MRDKHTVDHAAKSRSVLLGVAGEVPTAAVDTEYGLAAVVVRAP